MQTTNLNVKLATYPDIVKANAAKTLVVEGAMVEYVCLGQPCHIQFEKYTSDYKQMKSRPYVVVSTGRGYASLDNAVRAMFKEGITSI